MLKIALSIPMAENSLTALATPHLAEETGVKLAEKPYLVAVINNNYRKLVQMKFHLGIIGKLLTIR